MNKPVRSPKKSTTSSYLSSWIISNSSGTAVLRLNVSMLVIALCSFLVLWSECFLSRSGCSRLGTGICKYPIAAAQDHWWQSRMQFQCPCFRLCRQEMCCIASYMSERTVQEFLMNSSDSSSVFRILCMWMFVLKSKGLPSQNRRPLIAWSYSL